jgi:glycosyltransferase involved in cell wall biosynthesis
MHCGLDLSPFAQAYDRVETRRQLQIPEHAWVVGHVGRMDDVKNHRLIIDTFAKTLPQAENAYLLLVGDGPLRGDIEYRAHELGVIDRVKFAGNRNDVPRILCAAVDAFVFPSKLEGLGIALIEAQAAGLPCLVSDVVPREADVVPELVTRLSLSEPWAPTLLRTRNDPRRQKQSLAQVLRSDFSIQQGIAALQCTYEEGIGESGRDTCVEAIK